MIQLQLFNVMDEFFRRTSTWRYANDITLTEDTQYDLSVPSGAVVVRALSVGHNGTRCQRPAAPAVPITMRSPFAWRSTPKMNWVSTPWALLGRSIGSAR